MTIKTEHAQEFRAWRQNLQKDSRWAILINADPDALASAMALKRIMYNRVRLTDIIRINEVSRPDNLAMIRYLRISVKPWQPERLSDYSNYALVDSQPSHNKAFDNITYSLVIDHHPLTDISNRLTPGAFSFIGTGVGANSTIMTQFLQALRVRPGPLLATGLLYGIRTDTGAFERSGGEEEKPAETAS